MTVAPQAETEVVSGIIQGIVAKGGDKYQVEVNVGQQNPRRLWTKDASLVQQLMMMVGQQTSFLCGISHWTNAQNQPVRSLWINGVGQAAAAPQAPMVPSQPVAPPPAAPQLPVQQPTVVTPTAMPMAAMQQPLPVAHVEQQRTPDSVREIRIMRQTASKVASILISHVPAEQRTLDNVLRLSEQLVGYYEQGMQAATSPATIVDGDPGPQGVPHTDDDIPF